MREAGSAEDNILLACNDLRTGESKRTEGGSVSKGARTSSEKRKKEEMEQSQGQVFTMQSIE